MKAKFEEDRYRPYLMLCRALKLPRLALTGDAWWYESKEVPGHVRHSSYPDGQIELTENNGYAVSFWLPTMADWLDMLSSHGVFDIEIVSHPNAFTESMNSSDDFWVVAEPNYGPDSNQKPFVNHAWGQTREEAIARLYMISLKAEALETK